MLERAELMKFLYIFSSKLKNNIYKSIFDNNYVNLQPIKRKKINVGESTATTQVDTKEALSVYRNLKNGFDKNRKKTFKTKIVNSNQYINCDICGERIKIGTISLYSYHHNIIGHYDHVLNFVNTFCRSK